MFNLAIFLTVVRLLLAPLVVWKIMSGEYGWALGLFLAGALTDLFDGIIARRWNQTTDLGARLDPIADKCLMNGTLLALFLAGVMPWWFAASVFLRDIFILVGALVIIARTSTREFSPSGWGKICTFLQIIVIAEYLTMLAFPLIASPMANDVLSFTLFAAVVFIGISGLNYGWRGLRVLYDCGC